MSFDRSRFSPPDESGHYGPSDDGEVRYVYDDTIVLAVNLALATARPLLVTGPPGSGKSTLARDVARVKGWRYLQTVITSRTQAEDLLSGFDVLRRLSDAHIPNRELLPDDAYVEPGILWWAFDPHSAVRRGISDQRWKAMTQQDQDRYPPATNPEVPGQKPDAVVLLDEIDKADPDVPNDLLESLDRRTFTVRETRAVLKATCDLLVIITSNGERDLPPAFMRRCILLKLQNPNKDWLVKVAGRHFGPRKDGLYGRVAQELLRLQGAAQMLRRREPSTAEYLNTVDACRSLKVSPDDDVWEQVVTAAMWKGDEPPPARRATETA